MRLLGQKKKLWLAISSFLIVLGMVALIFYPPKIGLDFTGGSLLEVSGKPDLDIANFTDQLKQVGVTNIATSQTGDGGVLIKAKEIDQVTHQKVTELLAKEGIAERRLENVGPVVGKDLTQKAILAVLAASLAIIGFIAYSFRNVPKPASSWRFGVTAVIALIHDLFITLGIFALLSHWFGYEIDALFITALLTVMGFSVHDTIVVFDRLRESMHRTPITTAVQFEAAADLSLLQTLNRSLNTSMTTILVLLALAMLGGDSIRPFVVTLLVGISIGTFSSIFTAVPLLVVWQRLAMSSRKANR